MSTIRVLVVDDSAFARKVFRKVLAAEPDIEVVDYARDGLDALELIDSLRPDVVTLDLMMPNLDGLGVLRALTGRELPRVVLVTTSARDSRVAVEALALGAITLVNKPTALATEQLYDLGRELVDAVREAGCARPVFAPRPVEPAPPVAASVRTELVVVGTSTGGPQALARLLAALPADLPVPVACALHIPAGYTQALAERLDRTCALRVIEAADGLVLAPATAVIARGGEHLRVVRQGGALVCRIGGAPVDAPYAPSVDRLFESAAAACGGGVLGVILTGMGSDGVQGCAAIRGAGGRVLSEAESSCVVYGMPRAVADAGLSEAEIDLVRMARAISERL